MDQEKINFIRHLKAKNLSESTIKSYCNYYDLLLKKRKFDQDNINDFILKHPSNVTRAFLKNFFDHHNIYDVKIVKQTGRKKKREKLVMSNDHYLLIRDYILKHSDPIYIILLDLSYYCGLRRAEVLGIKIDCFNWHSWSGNRGVGRLKIIGKGDKQRTVVVPKLVMEEVYAYVKANMSKIKEGKLFPYTFMLWQTEFKNAVRSIKDFPDYTLHDLRRARATKWYREGKDLIQIKNRLGHADISTTQLYVTPDAEKELDVWERELQ